MNALTAEPSLLVLKEDVGGITESYYEATVSRPARAPPLRESIDVDVGVVGGGYAGISGALELAERGYSVALLEAQRLGWGASGRNGGQVLVGLGSEGECAIEEQLSVEWAKRAWNISVEGVQLEPHQIVVFERPRDAQRAFCGEVEVEVDDRLCLALCSLGERVEELDERVLELRGRIAVEPVAVEAGHQHLRLVAGNDDVRLEGGEAALDPPFRVEAERRSSLLRH